ncbi:MAG: hypothetical protein ACYDCX_10605 [Acidithiobacillus sp.]
MVTTTSSNAAPLLHIANSLHNARELFPPAHREYGLFYRWRRPREEIVNWRLWPTEPLV